MIVLVLMKTNRSLKVYFPVNVWVLLLKKGLSCSDNGQIFNLEPQFEGWKTLLKILCALRILHWIGRTKHWIENDLYLSERKSKVTPPVGYLPPGYPASLLPSNHPSLPPSNAMLMPSNNQGDMMTSQTPNMTSHTMTTSQTSLPTVIKQLTSQSSFGKFEVW